MHIIYYKNRTGNVSSKNYRFENLSKMMDMKENHEGLGYQLPFLSVGRVDFFQSLIHFWYKWYYSFILLKTLTSSGCTMFVALDSNEYRMVFFRLANVIASNAMCHLKPPVKRKNRTRNSSSLKLTMQRVHVFNKRALSASVRLRVTGFWKFMHIETARLWLLSSS